MRGTELSGEAGGSDKCVRVCVYIYTCVCVYLHVFNAFRIFGLFPAVARDYTLWRSREREKQEGVSLRRT